MLGGELRTLTSTQQLIDEASCDRIIATMDEDLGSRCSREQAALFVAQLLACYPSLSDRQRSPREERDYVAYTLKLAEAFQQFSAVVCAVIVHGGTGVPARQRYKPQPSDIVEAGNAEVDRLRNAKTMAQWHNAERQKRLREKREREEFEASLPSLETRRAQVAKLMAMRSRIEDAGS